MIDARAVEFLHLVDEAAVDEIGAVPEGSIRFAFQELSDEGLVLLESHTPTGFITLRRCELVHLLSRSAGQGPA